MQTSIDQTQAVSRPVRVPPTLAEWPGSRVRLGLIALATDHASERELADMAPREDVEIYVSRVANANPTTVENLRAMAPDLTRAASLILPGSALHAVAYSCTSGTVIIGESEVAARIHEAHREAACTTPITAALAGFEALGVRSVSVLTPYIDEVNRPVRDYLESRDIRICAFHSFHLESDVDMSRIPPAAIYQAAVDADTPQAQALFISCTALRASSVIQDLEDQLGKPVVTSNQAMLWHALRLSGYRKPVPGYGRLLRS